jgi:hypothetical protein
MLTSERDVKEQHCIMIYVIHFAEHNTLIWSNTAVGVRRGYRC